MAKAIVIADIKYKQNGQGKQFRDLLKYLQFRDGSIRRESYLRGEGYGDQSRKDAAPLNRESKWVDRGMGETYKDIMKNAVDLRGRKVLARTWVLSPDPELMQHIPADQRLGVVQRMTEETVNLWYGDNGWGQPEYSYVIHDKQRAADRLQMLHAHIITPGTVFVDAPGELGRMDHIVKRPHMADLQHTAVDVFRHEMERVLGKERTHEILIQREEALQRARTQGGIDKARMAGVRSAMQLMRQEANRKKYEKAHKAQMRQQDARMYARYIREESRKRREADRQHRRILAVQRLEAARDDHEIAVERLRQYRSQAATRAELAKQEDEERQALQHCQEKFFDTDDARISPTLDLDLTID